MLLCVGRGHGCFICLYLSKTLIVNYFFYRELNELNEIVAPTLGLPRIVRHSHAPVCGPWQTWLFQLN
jgi:hypothetical protein